MILEQEGFLNKKTNLNGQNKNAKGFEIQHMYTPKILES